MSPRDLGDRSRTGVYATHFRMATPRHIEIEDPPVTFTSPVWANFGFPVDYNNGNRVIGKTRVVCRKCFTKVAHTTGNTSNMQAHLRRHHPDIDISSTRNTVS